MKEDSQNIENIVFKPELKERKKVSFVWIIPVIILFALSWIAYESYMKKGTNIVVTFKNAEGIKKNVTPLEYKGIQLGKVTNISISKDLKSVDINILVNSDVAKYIANTNSRFWIKKPRVTLTKISGLSTLISGYKIELSPKYVLSEENVDELEEKLNFVGFDAKPDNDLSTQGYYVTLLANDDSNVEIGTPIFYNKFQIGELVSKDLKDEQVLLKAYIYDNYNYLVNKSSKFILDEALKVSYGAAGLNIKIGSVYSAIVGGITVVTSNKDAKPITKDEKYTLFSSKEDVEKKQIFNITFSELDGIEKNTPILYKGIKVGQISDIKLGSKNILAKAYLFEQYKYLLTNKTKFFVQEPEVSMNGVKNLGNIIKGNYIALKYEQGQFSDTFTIVDKNQLDFSKEDILLTLYSKNLNSISKNSKLYYKNIQVGKVVDYSLTKSLNKVKIKVSIDSKYKDILNDHILFYDMSSKLVQIKNLKLDINYSGIESLLNGAIGIVGEKRKSQLKKKEFKLYSSYQDVQRLKRIYNKGFVISAYFNNDFEIKPNMAIKYKNQEIGFVKDIKFANDKSKVDLFIYNSFKKYITKKSRFYKKGIVQFKASLSGVLFEVDNFASLLEGSIYLDTNSSVLFDKYHIYSSFDDMKKSSNSISIIFDDVEGLQKDFSQLKYKGVNIGKVIDISLNKQQKVEVKALIYNDYDIFARSGTIFFLKKPKISLSGVSNLGSTVMAVNIGVIKGKGKYKTKFQGYDSKPLFATSSKGSIFKVEDASVSSVGVDSPIYYKNVQIGKVVKLDLKKDGSKVIIDCLIWNKYLNLIRRNSKFYDISGFKMDFSLFEKSKIEANTVTSIIKGGLVVVTPYDYEERASSKTKFILHKKLEENWKTISPSIKY